MMHPDLLRLIFVVFLTLEIVELLFLSIYFGRKTFGIKKYVITPLLIAVCTLIAYCLFILSADYKLAALFESLFFVGTDWLVLCIFLFSIQYTEKESKLTGIFSTVLIFLTTADTISIILNNIYFHAFDLVLLSSSMGIGSYWGNTLFIPFYQHLALLSIMVILSLVFLGSAAIKIASSYKIKYIVAFISYLLIVVPDFTSIICNLPFDISLLFYGVMGGFISQYAVAVFPKRLLNKSLMVVNDSISDAVIYYDFSGKCIYANKSAKELFSNEGEFFPELTETYRERWTDQLASNERKIKGHDTFKDNGKITYYEVTYQREYGKKAEIGSSLKLVDRTEDIRDFERERDVAIHDPLTGILNRVGFLDNVDALVEKYGTQGWLLLSSNIRDFQLINEYFGEQRGDEVLKRQASICQTNAHAETVFGRINDDKLALYTRKEYFSEKQFLGFMEHMAELTDCPYYKMKLSVGVYDPQGKKEKAQVMYDKALLAAEHNHQNYDKVFSYYDSGLMGQILRDRRLSDSVAEAIADNEIEMYLQPIMDRKGKCVGGEALSRWRSPHFGDMMPAQFISILEKSGKIYLLDVYIWEQAAKLLKRWKEKGLDDNFISVNVSIKDFFYTDIFQNITSIIEKNGISPKNFRVEITETVLMSDYDKVFFLAEQLRDYGIKVAIDNFGNGCSSLNMLKDFKAECIKIDMELLKNVETESRSRIILESVIEMANGLGMETLGSGVGTKEQYEVLKKSKCQYFQGEYISSPVPVVEFEMKYNMKKS